ncbi:cytochrome c1 [Novosphingobium sp. FKTRR1]|uniref:cytochrome c1 n=1 Tax=unclassified Novosphingobium TaxID=2644732 RepID=UPI001CF0B999|nr:cytochrome c1 [Novosphingobium sp. FKTRR1]
MVRLFGPLVGLFFAVALLWSFGVGLVQAIREPEAATAIQLFHKAPEEADFSFNGVFGKFERPQLQRGFQIYQQVCANCHSLKQVAFRDLAALGYNEAEVKAIAKNWPTKAKTFDPKTGDAGERANTPADHFPPVYYAGTGNPPDLSLITKARHEGPEYVASLLQGYTEQPAALLKQFPDAKTPEGLHYNPYFANLNIAMPPPLTDDAVTYSDGTKATLKQESEDVAAFLTWTAEPKLEKRRQTGWAVVGFLLVATVLAYLAKKNVWANAH